MSGDFSDFAALEADLRNAPSSANQFINKAIEVTARKIRDDWRKGAAVSVGDGYSAQYASSIFYDIKYPGGSIEAEIGPELGRPGGSAGFLEDANGGVDASPQHAGRNAVEAHENDFIRGLEKALFDAATEAVDG